MYKDYRIVDWWKYIHLVMNDQILIIIKWEEDFRFTSKSIGNRKQVLYNMFIIVILALNVFDKRMIFLRNYSVHSILRKLSLNCCQNKNIKVTLQRYLCWWVNIFRIAILLLQAYSLIWCIKSGYQFGI